MSRASKSRISVLACVALVAIVTLVAPKGFTFAAEDKAAKDAEKTAKKEVKTTEKKTEIDAMASKALKEITAKSPEASALYTKSVGYAAFENLKVAVGISGGGGSGVAVPKKGQRVYMKMGTGGVGLGLGAQKYQVVFFFENDAALKSFIDKGWQADASAQASAADKGANASATFKNGVAVFQMTDKGLMASADISGTKYWKNDDLNK